MKIIKRIKTLVLAVVMSLGVLLPSFAGITASATMSDTYYDARTGAGKISAKEAGRSSDPKYKNIKESYMNARYEYMIKTTDETEVTVNKEGQSSIDKGSYMKVAPDSNQYWKLENSWKGNITATYSHCGYYKGTEIDVKLTLMDWEFLDNNSSRNSTVTTSDDASNVYVYFPGKNLRNDGTNRIGVSAVYCSWIKVKYSFVKSGTNTAVNVQGYTTFNDIDACQGVNFIENYKDIITTNTADNLSCVILNDDDTPYIFDGSTSGANTNDAEKKNWVTNTFAGTSMTVAFTFASNSKSSTGEVNGGNGWIINYNKKAVRSEFASPVKTVSDSDEKEASSNTLNGREIFTYKISHHVPYEIEENWYSAYGIYDTLSNDLQLLNTDIRDETGKTYSGQVKYSQTPTSDGVRYLWLFEDVKREDFYDNTYIITLTVRLKDTVDISSKDYKITNYAQATFTGSTFSQSTDVITKVKPISPSISKYINSIGRESYSLHKNNEDITYTGTIFGGDAKQYSRVEINDTLAEGLTYKSLYIYDGNGNDITSYGTNSSRGSNVKFTFNSNRLNSIFNKNLTYKLVVTADKEYDEVKHTEAVSSWRKCTCQEQRQV